MRSYLDIINECVKIEMDMSTHVGEIEDFETPIDFYLENVKRDSYVNEFLPSLLNDNESQKYDMWDIRRDVETTITHKIYEMNQILTFQEAAEIWGKDDSTLRRTIPGSKELIDGIDYRKSGKVWLVTRSAMIKLYGNPK